MSAEPCSHLDGADPTPTDPACWPTAGQLWHQLLGASPGERNDRLVLLLDLAHRGAACAEQGHFGLIPR